MKSIKLFSLFLFFSFCMTGLVWSQGQPYLKKNEANVIQLIVDGKPFMMLAGELGNSTASYLGDLDRIFADLRQRNLNTVLVPVMWEHIEPQEGKFDFKHVDGIISSARKSDMKIVLLWFGSWKNTYSSYIPEWIKRDTKRFPRVLMRNGRPTERLTPLNANNRNADIKAYAALMKHIKVVDTDRTILMIQVENEVGVIPEPRDFSSEANAAFRAAVPKALMDYMIQNIDKLEPELHAAWIAAGKKTQGSWQEIFGAKPFTDDLFMAWHYASYIGAVAAAGKNEYNIPMFTNAALIRPNYLPGQYNSGGPLPHSMDLWRVAGMPGLDFISPDIYFSNFAYWAERYNREGNPLFIPETAGGATGAANVLYAFGQQNAIGFSPFGIEGRGATPPVAPSVSQPGAAPRPDIRAANSDPLANAYAMVEHLKSHILEKQGTDKMAALVLEGREQRNGRIEFGGYIITINWSGGGATTTYGTADNSRVGVLFIKTGEDEFLVAGSGGASLSFAPAIEGNHTAGIASIDEEALVDGNWILRRRLNGDQNGQGQVLNISSQAVVYKLRLYRY